MAEWVKINFENSFYSIPQPFSGTPKPLAAFYEPSAEKPTVTYTAQRPTAPYPPQQPAAQYTNAGPYPVDGMPSGMSAAWSQFVSQYGGVPYPYPVMVPAQTQFEGYLVPIQMKSQPPPTLPSPPTAVQPYAIEPTNTLAPKSPNADIVAVLRNILPPSVLYFLVNWGSIIMNSFSIIAFGGIMTTAICTLTPLCTISLGTLPFGFRGEFAGKAGNANETNTLERVRRASEMLSSAIDTYEELQKSVTNDRKSKSKPAN